jgi:hypothetical protein
MINVILILMLTCGIAQAQETIVSYNENSLPVLNEEFRSTRQSLRERISEITALQTQVSDLEDEFDTSSGHDHDGTDSKQIDYNNLLNTPTIPTQYFTLSSATTVTDVEDPQTSITIDSTKEYMLAFEAYSGSGGGAPARTRLENITFNSSGASEYGYYVLQKIGATAVSDAGEGTSIPIEPAGDTGSVWHGRLSLTFSKLYKGSEYIVVSIQGALMRVTYVASGLSEFESYEVYGMFSLESTDITSINFDWDNGAGETTSAKYLLYEMVQ